MSHFADFRTSCRLDHFTENDLKTFFSDKDGVFLQNFVARGIRSGKMIRVMRGVYLFSPEWSVGQRSLFSLANVLVQPSYVSFESALSFHGLIPEAVPVTMSACSQRRQKELLTPAGVFTFYHIPCASFFDGVFRDADRHALVAHPIRALFDMCYFRRKGYISMDELDHDLRIDPEALRSQVEQVNREDLEALANSYRRRNIRELAKWLGEYAK